MGKALDEKAHRFFDDEIIPITPPIYYCFSFPIKYYKTTPGKYRISISLWNDMEK